MTDVKPAKAGAQENSVAYGQSLAAVRELIRTSLLEADPVMTQVMEHVSLEQGKNFRARLLLAVAAGPDGMVSTDAISAAAALEILHLATLIHDDIIDDAPTRRGQPSVQGRFGKKTAVITGDYLFCVSISLVAGLSERFPQRHAEFARAMTQVCLGEMRQFSHNWDTQLSAYSYLKIIAGKTASLFALAAYAGAVLGGLDEQESRQLGRLGLALGMQFQLADDCLDYEATADTFKKSVQHDLVEGVITLPLIMAFARSPILRETVKGEGLAVGDVTYIVAEAIRLGGVADAWNLASRYYSRATSRLGKVGDPVRRERLRQILESIISRKH
jgi:heptaprenyl diphosphate synthase